MSMYSSVLLSEVQPLSVSLTSSRRAAERYAQLQAVQERGDRVPQPLRLLRARRRVLGRRPQRTTA